MDDIVDRLNPATCDPTLAGMLRAMGDGSEEIMRLRAGIEGLRRNYHDECEDSWYSCAQHPDCADDRRRGGPCDCGMDAFNAKLDALLSPSPSQEPSKNG
jgi:hypothetical protein